jgi:Flp pilus assembly protein TadB
VFVIGVILCGLLLLREKENNRQREQKRQEKLRRCYPWFVNELVLLLGAGMQVKNIIAILLSEYEMENERKEDDREPLMEELQIAKQSLQMGMPEQQVYYQLGRRLKLSCYIKLMTLLEQNVKRGTKGLTVFFEQEEAAALEERKNLAKRYGEEAGTKLLGPMMLQLLVVMLMIMVPAFMSFM